MIKVAYLIDRPPSNRQVVRSDPSWIAGFVSSIKSYRFGLLEARHWEEQGLNRTGASIGAMKGISSQSKCTFQILCGVSTVRGLDIMKTAVLNYLDQCVKIVVWVTLTTIQMLVKMKLSV